MSGEASERLIRVDSVVEQHAYLAVYPPPGGAWRIESQTVSTRDDEVVDIVRVRSVNGQERTLRFDVTSFYDGAMRMGQPTTDHLDRVMRAAVEFGQANEPHHPGSLPRFPVPSDRYPGRLDVPLAILAVDEAGRGLFAPPRVVTMSYPEGEPFGVGEFPGFDPDRWPPERLGDWPPPDLAELAQEQLPGSIARFSACAMRLYDAWLGGSEYPQRREESREYLRLLLRLDLEAMLPYYRTLGGHFLDWVSGGR